MQTKTETTETETEALAKEVLGNWLIALLDREGVGAGEPYSDPDLDDITLSDSIHWGGGKIQIDTSAGSFVLDMRRVG